jgi:uncharacterized protein YijF (DUF1287 family)
MQTGYFNTWSRIARSPGSSMVMRMRTPFIVFVFICANLLAATHSGDNPEFSRRLVSAAIERTNHAVRYDPAYIRIPYPGGDVPGDIGVCTDEIIRAYRVVGVDLQKEVHEDMEKNFSAYPRKWKWFAGKLDSNIDHRRVPNLMVFFAAMARPCQSRIWRGTIIPAISLPMI